MHPNKPIEIIQDLLRPDYNALRLATELAISALGNPGADAKIKYIENFLAHTSGTFIVHNAQELRTLAQATLKASFTAYLYHRKYVRSLLNLEASDLHRITRVQIRGDSMMERVPEVFDFLSSPHLVNLESFVIVDHPILTPLNEMLSWQAFSHLKALHLTDVFIGPDEALELANSATLSSINDLELACNQLESTGVSSIMNSDHLTNVTKLAVYDSDIARDGLAWFRQLKRRNVEMLELGDNDITDSDIEHLVASPYLETVKRLSLSDNQLSADGILEVTRSLPGLEELRLHSNPGMNYETAEAIKKERPELELKW